LKDPGISIPAATKLSDLMIQKKETRRSSMNLCTCLTHYLWGVPNGTCLQVKILHLAVLQGCLTCWDQGIDPPEIGGEDHFHCEAFTWDGQSISMDSKWPWRNPDYLKLANHHQSPQSGAICLIILYIYNIL
jgi:hypothetical protein